MSKERQHYVPQSLLRHFTYNKKKSLIWAYDKSNDKQFSNNISKICAGRGFYDINIDGEELSIEKALSQIEGDAAKIIKNIIRHKTLNLLNEHTFDTLATFITLQFLRTKEYRQRYTHLIKISKQHFIDKFGDISGIEDYFKSNNTPEFDEKLFCFSIMGKIDEFLPHFKNKNWLLFETNSSNPFYISDNPVTLQNQKDFGFYGNIGIGVPNIEISIPLSTTLCLWITCPLIAEELQKSLKTDPKNEELLAHLSAWKTGNSLFLDSEHVKRFNYLQVLWSERFVYCANNKFELVKEMINENEDYRSSWKIIIN